MRSAGSEADGARGPALPAWLQTIARGAEQITVQDLTRFLPPEDADPRRGAVLMLFAEHPEGPEMLLTERAHGMRSHPGQVSFPGGRIDAGESAAQAALREAWEETGLEPDGVEIFAELPELWLPPSNFAVTPVLGWWREPGRVHVASPAEVHAIHRVHLHELLAPEHRIRVRAPSGWIGPGFLIGEEKDVICWGFTAGVISRLFDFLGWSPDAPEAPVHDLPEYMLVGRRSDASTEQIAPRGDQG